MHLNNELPKYGILYSEDIKIHRQYFEEMVSLIGINVLYYSPKPGISYSINGDYSGFGNLIENYNTPIQLGCIFEEHPNQYTTRKLGWNSEQVNNSSLIHLPYDTPGIQENALVAVPSGIDNAKGRLFRIVRMYNTMVYPASILCEIVPEWEDTSKKADTVNFKRTDFNVLKGEG